MDDADLRHLWRSIHYRRLITFEFYSAALGWALPLAAHEFQQSDVRFELNRSRPFFSSTKKSATAAPDLQGGCL